MAIFKENSLLECFATVAQSVRDGVVPGQNQDEGRRDLYDIAEELRALRNDDDWKAPFNLFRDQVRTPGVNPILAAEPILALAKERGIRPAGSYPLSFRAAREAEWERGTPWSDPVYESPLEEYFASQLKRYLGPETLLTPQVEIDTRFSRFRLDFVASRNEFAVGIECDGKEFHDEGRDALRDILIVETGKVANVVRFRGTDIHNAADTCIFVLSRLYPGLFSERAHTNLRTLVDPPIRDRTFSRSVETVVVRLAQSQHGDDWQADAEFQQERVLRIYQVADDWPHTAERIARANSKTFDALVREMGF